MDIYNRTEAKQAKSSSHYRKIGNPFSIARVRDFSYALGRREYRIIYFENLNLRLRIYFLMAYEGFY